MNKKKLFFLVLCVIIVARLLIPSKSVLSISNRKNNSEKYYVDATRLEGFEIAYTHSVNKGRVHDYYSTWETNGELVLEKTRFVSYGAGIPEPEEMEGCQFVVTENGYEIRDIDRKLKKLVMAVGLIAEHSITFWIYKNDIDPVSVEYKLKDLFAPQTSIILEIKRVSLLSYILHKL